MTAVALSQNFWFIRHGRSAGQAVYNNNGDRIGKPATRDDPLGEIGINQAQDLRLRYHSIWGEIENLIVISSPLSRAFETTSIVFGDQPNATIILDPLLREFNHHQRKDKEIYCRHAGSPWENLKQKFKNENIVWPLNESDMWWEPHGNFSDCVGRIMKFSHKLWNKIEGNPAATFVLVAHENVYRILTGEFSIPNCSPTQCILQKITQGDEENNYPAVMISEQLKNTTELLVQTKEQTNILCILGCSVKEECQNRIQSGLDALANSKSFLIFLGNAEENIIFFLFLREYISKHYCGIDFTSRILMDPFSRTTICNAKFSLMRIYSILNSIHSSQNIHTLQQNFDYEIHVVTSYWHSPRAYLIFQQTFDQFTCIAPIKTFPVQSILFEKEIRKHLLEHLIFANAVERDFDYWPVVLHQCANELMLVRERIVQYSIELLIQRKWKAEVEQEMKKALLDALRVSEHNLPMIINICSTAVSKGIPIVLLPLHKNGSTAIHFAASYGSVAAVEVLVFLFGANIRSTNLQDNTALFYSEKKSHLPVSKTLRGIHSLLTKVK